MSMSIDEIIAFIEDLEGVVTLRPEPGDGSPEISWGDTFFSYAPDGEVPTTSQLFATVVTKDYPGDERSRLDRPGTFRLNLAAGKEAFTRWTGRRPGDAAANEAESAGTDPAVRDSVMAHPVYGTLGWLAVVNPGARTEPAVRELLRTAHHLARARHQRRTESRPH